MVRITATTLQSECTEAERAALAALLGRSAYREAHLEIGTAAGGTLKELIGVYPDEAARPAFHVIDPMTYFPDQLAKIRQNLSSAGIDPDSVTFHIGTTQQHLAPLRSDGVRFDFIFIDGDHRAYPVLIDLQFADLLNAGGAIALHDDKPGFPGVGWAIRRFLSRNPEFEHLGTTDSLTILRRIRPSERAAVSQLDLAAAYATQVVMRWRQSARKRLGRV